MGDGCWVVGGKKGGGVVPITFNTPNIFVGSKYLIVLAMIETYDGTGTGTGTGRYQVPYSNKFLVAIEHNKMSSS